MITEFRKSINSILYERLTSPLSGAFILSWLVWNWKIVYLTIFIDQDKILGNKIDYITTNYSNQCILIWYPLFSCIILVTVYPFFAMGTFWLTAWFNKVNLDIKTRREDKQVLTLEQSIELREEIRTQEELFDKLLKKKDEEIKTLKVEIDFYQQQFEKMKIDLEYADKPQLKQYKSNYEKLKTNQKLFEAFKVFAPQAQTGTLSVHDIDNNDLDYFLANDVLMHIEGGIYFKFTDEGRHFNKLLLDEQLKS